MRCGGWRAFTSPKLMTNALEIHHGDEGGEIRPDQHAASHKENTATLPPYIEHSKEVVCFIFFTVHNKKEMINYILFRTKIQCLHIAFVLKH